MLSLIRHQSPSSDVTVNPTFQKETSEYKYKLQIDQRQYDLSEICLDHFNLAQQNSTTWVLTCLALLDKSAMKRSKYFKYLGKTKKEQKSSSTTRLTAVNTNVSLEVETFIFSFDLFVSFLYSLTVCTRPFFRSKTTFSVIEFRWRPIWRNVPWSLSWQHSINAKREGNTDSSTKIN